MSPKGTIIRVSGKQTPQIGTEKENEMLELKKVESNMFNEYYEGIAVSGAKVICILDDNCVRYTALTAAGKRIARREYGNTGKATCFKKATETLNRI